MKKTHIGAGVVAAILTCAGAALADQWTGSFTIDTLSMLNGGDSYIVSGSSTINPARCASTDYREVGTSVGAASREFMNRTLLSAFLAGRKVRLNLSQNQCGATGRPAYYAVQLDAP
jgi:hypothetical protein